MKLLNVTVFAITLTARATFNYATHGKKKERNSDEDLIKRERGIDRARARERETERERERERGEGKKANSVFENDYKFERLCMRMSLYEPKFEHVCECIMCV